MPVRRYPVARQRERSLALLVSVVLHAGAIVLLVGISADKPRPAAVPPAAIVATLVTRASPAAVTTPAPEAAPSRPVVTPPEPKSDPKVKRVPEPATVAPAASRPVRMLAERSPRSVASKGPPPPTDESGSGAASAAHAGPVMVQFPYAYLARMSRTIVSRLNYPAYSRQFGEEGRAIVRVTLRRDGSIVDAVVVRQTGYPNLDAEARNVIVRIARFAPVPDHIDPTRAEFVIDQPISFKRR